MHDESGPTARIARFTATTGWNDLPDAVRHAARRNLLNVAACALGGRADPAIAAFSTTLGALAGAGRATEIGAGPLDPGTAAFLNAASANVQDFDDQHLPTVMHPGPVIVSAALALAEAEDADGATLLSAVAAGLEVGCRIGNAVTPGHYAHGFHITTTCGVFGAAVAAARILGLDAERTGWALGHAAAQSAGLVEALGVATKSTGVGGAARAGVQAALFARAGVGGPAAPLEGRFGFLRVMASSHDASRITAGLGTEWEMLRNAPKAYPVGVVLHSVVDACLELRGREGFAAEAVTEVEIAGHPLLRTRADRPHVTTGREATVSAQHVAAAALLRGTVGPAELSDAAVADPAIRALAARVRVVEDPTIPVEAARVVARTPGGEASAWVPLGRGLPGRAITDDELDAKARLLAVWGAPWCDADRLVALCRGADALPDLAPLSAALRHPARTP